MHAKEKTMKKSGNSTLVNLGHFHINQRSFSSLLCMGIKNQNETDKRVNEQKNELETILLKSSLRNRQDDERESSFSMYTCINKVPIFWCILLKTEIGFML